MSKQITTACIFIYCSIFVASSIYVMIPLQPILAELFTVSLGFASLSSTLFIFPYALGLLFFGILADRFPLRYVLLAGMILLTFVTGLLSFSHSIYIIIVLRAFQGILAASFAPVTFAYCFKHFKGALQAFTISMINTGFLFAGVFGQMISAYVVSLFTFQAVFIVFFCLYFTCFIGLYFTLRPSSSKKSYKLSDLYSTILSCFRHHSLQKLYSIAFFLLLTIMLFYGAFEFFLYREWKGFPLSLQLLRSVSLLGIIPAFFASPLTNRFGAKKVLRFQLGVMVIGFLPAAIHLNVTTVMIASLLMIISTSLTIPMVVLLVGKHAGPSKSTAVALYSFVLLIGASIGSTLASSLSFTLVVSIIPVLFTALVAFAKFIPD